MNSYRFSPHALREMARDNIPYDAIYHVVGDADDVIEQDDGRTMYEGIWEGRAIVVVVEADGETVVSAWERKRESRRKQRRRR